MKTVDLENQVKEKDNKKWMLEKLGKGRTNNINPMTSAIPQEPPLHCF